MTIDYQTLRQWHFPDVEQTYDWRYSARYALALGLGHDPTDPAQLRYVYEDGMQALPTMAVVLCHPGFWLKNPGTGVDWVRSVHGEQSLVVHRPLPAAATLVGRTRVEAVVDKGAGKGALILVERKLYEQGDEAPLASARQVFFARGDGGYSSGGQPSDAPPEPLPRVPAEPADAVCDIATRPEAALLYRLSGDFNPLHADPAVARAAGFPQPILQGLCTYGVAAHAVLRACCDYDAARLEAFAVRFTAPVYPGETLRTEMWRRGREVHLRTRALERDVIVLDQGLARLAEA